MITNLLPRFYESQSTCTTLLCLKNIPPLTCYNLDIHDPSAINFGRSDTEKGEITDQMMPLFSHLANLVLQHYLAKEET